METNAAEKLMWDELDAAAEGYAEAKKAFDTVRLTFEVAKRRLEVTKELASEVIGSQEWEQWLETHGGVRYAGMAIGEAVLDYVRRHTHEFYQSASQEEFENTPIFRLETFRHELTRRGFEFRTATPFRELNAALINLAGIKKISDWYQAADAREIAEEVRKERESNS